MATRLLTVPLWVPDGSNVYPKALALTNTRELVWNFLKDVDGAVFGRVRLPNPLAGTPAIAVVIALAANATTGTTRMRVSTARYSDGQSIDPSLTAEADQDVGMPGSARFNKDVRFPAAGALNIGTPVADNFVVVRIMHVGSHANDTLAVDTELVRAWVLVDVP